MLVCSGVLVTAETQRLHDPRISLRAIAKLVQRKTIVVILVHLIENLVDSLLRCVLVFELRLLTLYTRSMADR